MNFNYYSCNMEVMNKSLKQIIENKLSRINNLTNDDCNKLNKLGFINVSTLNNIAIREKYSNYIEEYKLLYPNNLFITLFEINEILIENSILKFTSVDNYIYSISEKNLHDILNFNIKKEHIYNFNIYNEVIKNFDYEYPENYMILAPSVTFIKDGLFISEYAVFFKVFGGYLLVTASEDTQLISNPN